MSTLIIIAGPTASGKSALAMKLAAHYKTEIISADSRQFYTGMDIGTAKPSQEELESVKHHFINFLNPDQEYNIGRFEKDAVGILDRLFTTHDKVILAGGSGLYIRAVCEGLDDLPESDPEIRKKLNYIYLEEGIESLREKLLESDPDYFAVVDTSNPQRLMRAIEVIELTGKTYSSLRKAAGKNRSFKNKKIGLLIDRDELYQRINERVLQMFAAGLVDEVNKLHEYRAHNALQTVGYKEVFDYLDGKTSLEFAIEQVSQNTRNYARRQMTWFRKDKDIRWFESGEVDKMISYIESD
jgi:tRNA dimethylallyltransferase